MGPLCFQMNRHQHFNKNTFLSSSWATSRPFGWKFLPATKWQGMLSNSILHFLDILWAIMHRNVSRYGCERNFKSHNKATKENSVLVKNVCLDCREIPYVPKGWFIKIKENYNLSQPCWTYFYRFCHIPRSRSIVLEQYYQWPQLWK